MAREKIFSIALAGDVMLGRYVNETLRKISSEYPWGDLFALIREQDFRICNLECALSDSGTQWSKTEKVFHFRSDEKNIATLLRAHVDVVSIANNHILDYNEEGLARTISVLEQHSVGHAGAGMNLKEAQAPAVRTVHGMKIGFLAATDNQPEWEAGETNPGVFYVPIDCLGQQAQELFHHVRRLKLEGVFVIVSLHWGGNWGRKVPGQHIPFAHALIDAGADMIYGHSGHIFRGIEIYKEKPIFYCVGDFIDDYAVDADERNDETFLFIFRKGQEAAHNEILLYPVLIEACQARRAVGEVGKRILKKMHDLCRELGTTMEYREDYGVISLS